MKKILRIVDTRITPVAIIISLCCMFAATIILMGALEDEDKSFMIKFFFWSLGSFLFSIIFSFILISIRKKYYPEDLSLDDDDPDLRGF